MRYVFNLEGENEILGPYYRSVEDVVEYEVPGGAVRQAPADCVAVREVERWEIQREFARFKASIDSAAQYLGGGTGTAMNSLMALQAEMREYAYVMGARLTDDAATREMHRQAGEGRYIGARAHSRQFEEVPAGVREPGEKW